MAHTVFMAVFWIVVIAAFGGITFDLVRNIIKLRKSSIKSFEGEPVEVDAVVDEQTMTLVKNRKVSSDSMAQHVNIVSLSYKADGVTFTKEAELVDVMGKLKAGDTVKLVYDRCNSSNALFADGSETLSAKNAIKWDICYYIITLIVGMFLFLKIDAVTA
ncbi:MAG: hypothetical protein J6B75_02855 [Ruminococcus sp.]|nr:hypothetical protein [Ruminococcus sp.]